MDQADRIIKYVRLNLSTTKSMLNRPDGAKAIGKKLTAECPSGELADLLTPLVIQRAQGVIQESGLKRGLTLLFKSQPAISEELDFQKERQDAAPQLQAEVNPQLQQKLQARIQRKRALVEPIPHIPLPQFADNSTNKAAAGLYADYSARFSVGKAIALTRRDLLRGGFDLTPAAPRAIRTPPEPVINPSKPPKRQKPEPGVALFDDEELRFPTGMIRQASVDSYILDGESLRVGDRVPEAQVYRYAQSIHREPDDWIGEDGYIGENIERFSFYKLERLPLATLNLDEWEVEEDLVRDYAERGTPFPPIVYDPQRKSIIDGTHRCNAAKQRGDDSILAFVGISPKVGMTHQQASEKRDLDKVFRDKDGRPLAVIDGEIDLPGGVLAMLSATRGGEATIENWTSRDPGRGGTRIALDYLRAYVGAGEIWVKDPGPEGTVSYLYWKKMLSEGRVDRIEDDSNVDITQEMRDSTATAFSLRLHKKASPALAQVVHQLGHTPQAQALNSWEFAEALHQCLPGSQLKSLVSQGGKVEYVVAAYQGDTYDVDGAFSESQMRQKVKQEFGVDVRLTPFSTTPQGETLNQGSVNQFVKFITPQITKLKEISDAAQNQGEPSSAGAVKQQQQDSSSKTAAPSPLRVKVTNPQVDAKFFRLWMENLYNSGAYRPITHGAVQQGIRASDVLELPFYNVKIKDVAQIGSNLPDYDFLIQRVGNTGKVLTKTALQLNLTNGTYTNYTIYTPKSVDDLMRLCQGTAWLCKKGQTEVLRDNAEYYYGKVRFVMEEGKPVAAVDYNEGAVWDPELNRLMSGPIVNFAKTELKDFKQAPAPEHPNWPVKAHGKVAALFHDRGWITAKGEWLPVKGAVDMDAESTEGEEHHDMIAEKYFRGGTDSAYNHGWIRIGVYGKEGYADMGGCNDKQFDVMWKHFAEVQPKYIIFGYLVEGRLDLEDFLMCKNLADLKKAIKRTYMIASGQPTMGFNVNDSAAPFTDWILRGEKEIETRNSDSLRSHIGERVGIIRTGVGPATLVGYCTLGEPIIYRDNRDFRQDQSQHMVPEGPMWDVFPGMIKYGYPILDVEPCEPKLITSQGRVWRRLASF